MCKEARRNTKRKTHRLTPLRFVGVFPLFGDNYQGQVKPMRVITEEGKRQKTKGDTHVGGSYKIKQEMPELKPKTM